MFITLTSVLELTKNWMREYNKALSHDALNDLTPWEYLMKYEQAKILNIGAYR